MVISPDYPNSIEQGVEEYTATEHAFPNIFNAFVSVYEPTQNRSFLELNVERISKYVLDEPGEVYYCYIPELSEDYHNLDTIHIGCNVPNVDENVCSELASPHPAAEPIQYSNS